MARLQLLDSALDPLFDLYQDVRDPVTGLWTDDGAQWGVTGLEGPSLRPEGEMKTIPGTGTTVFVGSGVLLPGEFKLKVGVIGVQTRTRLNELIREFKWAFLQARWVQDGDYLLPLARFTTITDTQYPNPGRAEVDVSFQPALAYWLGPPVTVPIATGTTEFEVSGEANVPLRVELTASADVVNPALTVGGRTTTFFGTLSAGQTLVIDATPGQWTTTVNGLNRKTALRGPQPNVPPGSQQVLVTGAGLAGSLSYQPGVLMPLGWM